MRWLVMAGGLAAIAAAVWVLRRTSAPVHDARMGAMHRSAWPALGYFAGILLLLAGIVIALFGWFVV